MRNQNSNLDDLLSGPNPVEIDCIEIEIIGSDFWWHLSSEGERVFSACAGADEIGGMLEATRILTHVALRSPPPDLATWPGHIPPSSN